MPLLMKDILNQTQLPLKKRIYSVLLEAMKPSELGLLTYDEFFAIKLKVKNKAGKLVPFILNEAQWHYFLNRTTRDIILKARQHGFSTLIQGLAQESILRKPGTNIVIIANEAENTGHLVDIFERMYQNLPNTDRPYKKGSPPNPIRFPEKDSIMYIGTAGNRNWGRSKTVYFVHGSEVAFFPDAKTTMDGLLESVPPPTINPDTYVAQESTPNGAGGYFYEEVQRSLKGLSEYKTHFYPWWWSKEYYSPINPNESIRYTTQEEELIVFASKTGFNLTPGQIKWRRNKIQERQAKFFQEYPEDIQTCFLLSGRPRFNQEALQERLKTQCKKPIFQDYPIYNEGNVYYQLRIYEKPLNGHDYVIGADTSEGIQVTSGGESDFSAAIVRNRRTNRQVATIHGRLEPFEFAYMLQEVGKYYNNALIGVERNNHGHAVLGYLYYGTGDGTITPYTNLYSHWEDEKLGWPTNVKTRPMMIDDLALEYQIPTSYHINDEEIIGEALSFVVNDKGKAEGTPGAFDDLVLADAIACAIRLAPYTETDPQHGYEGASVRIGDF